MYKLCKWAYELGIKHERRRVKMLIAQHRNQRPNDFDYTTKEKLEYAEGVWYQVGVELDKLIGPKIGYPAENYTAPLDDES